MKVKCEDCKHDFEEEQIHVIHIFDGEDWSKIKLCSSCYKKSKFAKWVAETKQKRKEVETCLRKNANVMQV